MATIPWITISATDLNAYLVGEQVAALREEALAPGQGDPFSEISVDVISKVRAFIASNPSNLVDVDQAKIPPELKIDVAHLILAPMLGRLGIALTKDQEKQLEIAHSTLIALREKKLLVSQPENPIAPAVQGGSGVELISSAPRQATQHSLGGLL